MNILTDKKFRVPRIWSNKELRKFSYYFKGDVVNVSAWKDVDKEGSYYRNYFKNAKSYTITNYLSEARGFQGLENEIFLDLTKKLPVKLKNKFDVVFNHTTLEHIYDFKTAFNNICLMSKDIVIIVVPFLQAMHTNYGDYWRFTPSTIKRLFEENNMKVLYLSFNNQRNTSVYLFAIASKKPSSWKNKIPSKYSITCKNDFWDFSENYAGCRAITNNILFKVKSLILRSVSGFTSIKRK